MTLEICTGCKRRCTFNSAPITNEYSIDIEQPYYIPALGNTIIAAYYDNNGKKHTTPLCKTAQEAQELAKHISTFCCNHSQNAK
ncbi:MAG: hypothetical protein J6R22_04365 [Alphaproteobacteria bacterium]|nr:hypothetical protein [Alphaproteobacteria bacterium]